MNNWLEFPTRHMIVDVRESIKGLAEKYKRYDIVEKLLFE